LVLSLSPGAKALWVVVDIEHTAAAIDQPVQGQPLPQPLVPLHFITTPNC
jgi:hypothetical protein